MQLQLNLRYPLLTVVNFLGSVHPPTVGSLDRMDFSNLKIEIKIDFITKTVGPKFIYSHMGQGVYKITLLFQAKYKFLLT